MTAIENGADRLLQCLRRFARARRGSVLVEFAIAVPVMIVLLLGTFDTARYVLLHQKLDRAASTMADLVSRPPSISQSQVDSMFSAAVELLQPFDLTPNGLVIVTSISKASGEDAAIDWQRSGGGELSTDSSVGSSGTATLPDGFTVRDGENVIVTEVFFNYEPLFLDHVIDTGIVSHIAMRRPRRGDLSTLN